MARTILYLILLILITLKAYAYPCPNGNGLFYKGDSVEEVIKQCGEPTSKKTTTQSVYSLKKLTYVNMYPYDMGFLQMELFITNNKVSRIHMTDRNYSAPCRSGVTQVGTLITTQASCGDWIYDALNTNYCGVVFGIGETLENVQKFCGKPYRYEDLQSQENQNIELFYSGNNSIIMRFQNGKLVEWK